MITLKKKTTLLITQNSNQNSSNSIYARCIKNLPLSLQQYFCWQVALKRRVIFSVKCFRYIGRARKKLIGALRKKKEKRKREIEEKEKKGTALLSDLWYCQVICCVSSGLASSRWTTLLRGEGNVLRPVPKAGKSTRYELHDWSRAKRTHWIGLFMKSTGNMLVLIVNAVKGETSDWPKIQSLILIGSLML